LKRTVVAMFPRYHEAEQAVHKLLHQGVKRDDISIMALQEGEGKAPGESKPAKRAGAGAVVGGLAGAVLGLTALAIPGIGPLVAAGPIAGALTGVGGGLVAGGLMGAFIGLGLDHDSAQFYARGVENGGAVVAVNTDEFEVAERLRAMQASDVRQCATGDPCHGEGAPAPVVQQNAEQTPRYDAHEITPPHAGSHQHATGDAQHVEDASDTRVMTDQGPEHWAPHNESYKSSFDEYAGTLAREESTVLAGRGETYSEYREAYDFGYRQAGERDFAGQNWASVEGRVRSKWGERHSGEEWDRVSAAVQQGWESARGMG
jgi:hypothetical protein